MTPRERLAELVAYASAGMMHSKIYPIGCLTNAKRYPELADLKSSDAIRWHGKLGRRRPYFVNLSK